MKKQKQLPAPPAQSVPDKQAENRVLETYRPDEAKKIVLGRGLIQGDADAVLLKLGNEILPKYIHGTVKEKADVKKEMDELLSAAFYAFETETHIALTEGFPERLRGGAKEICKQFIHDFDCKNNAEKILAETAAIAFMRYLDGSRRLNGCMDVDEYISDGRTRYLGYLSKQMDRAHRQYLSTIMTLKQLKAPTIEMNIKTNTAFVSQNQQINATQPTEPNKNEIIDPK